MAPDYGEIGEDGTCQSCPVADALAELETDAENARAWELYSRIMSRFSVDTHSTALLLERVTVGLESDVFAELVERFALIYDVTNPQTTREPDPE